MNGLNAVVGGFIVAALLILLVCIAPLVALASLNTIFEQASIQAYIPHNVWTYLSVWGLALVFGGRASHLRRVDDQK